MRSLSPSLLLPAHFVSLCPDERPRSGLSLPPLVSYCSCSRFPRDLCLCRAFSRRVFVVPSRCCRGASPFVPRRQALPHTPRLFWGHSRRLLSPSPTPRHGLYRHRRHCHHHPSSVPPPRATTTATDSRCCPRRRPRPRPRPRRAPLSPRRAPSALAAVATAATTAADGSAFARLCAFAVVRFRIPAPLLSPRLTSRGAASS